MTKRLSFVRNPRLNRRQLLIAASALPLLGSSNGVRASTRSDVLVIGAGLSGLYAATLLAREGVKVTVLEARDRLGGRLMSLDELPGTPEAGGDSILGGYGRVLATAKDLGLTVINHASKRGLSKPEIALHGDLIPRAEWAAHPSNRLPDNAKGEFPGRRFFQKVVAANNPLRSHDDWLEPATRKLDNSVYDFLREQGWHNDTIVQNYETNIGRGTSAHDCSILTWFFRIAWDAQQRRLGDMAGKVEGGNQRLPEAMAATLPGDVLLNRTVVGVRQHSSGVVVTTQDGDRHEADRLISALPVPPMRWIGFDPVLPQPIARAIKILPSMMITKVLMEAKTPFWEKDGLDPGMWTDTALGEVRPLRQYTSNEITGLVARARGFTAQRLDTLGEAAARQLVVQTYEQLRPAAKGQLEAVGYKSWALDRYAGGSWTEWSPGQLHDHLPAFSESAGRLDFCGEHAALSNRGMEAAMESAERAAVNTLLRL